jgi:hypothetical protein
MHMTKDQQLLCLDCILKKYHNLKIIFNDLLMKGVEQRCVEWRCWTKCITLQQNLQAKHKEIKNYQKMQWNRKQTESKVKKQK